MFYKFGLVENRKIVNNSTTTKARDKNKHRFAILRTLDILLKFHLTKFKNDQILLNKISRIIFVITQLFIGWKTYIVAGLSMEKST